MENNCLKYPKIHMAFQFMLPPKKKSPPKEMKTFCDSIATGSFLGSWQRCRFFSPSKLTLTQWEKPTIQNLGLLDIKNDGIFPSNLAMCLVSCRGNVCNFRNMKKPHVSLNKEPTFGTSSTVPPNLDTRNPGTLDRSSSRLDFCSESPETENVEM